MGSQNKVFKPVLVSMERATEILSFFVSINDLREMTTYPQLARAGAG